ncbi:MAG: hypothetical protein HOM11_07525 [Methylococcales bacterium]|jgi:intracellular multiplication protein IcmK|nr:hypothetical protein [Methylococcales bacterium]MBT7444437.1 hypothetical protein [Methylococcales bacterium]
MNALLIATAMTLALLPTFAYSAEPSPYASEAFEQATQSLLPLTPSEIKRFRALSDRVERAKSDPLNTPAVPAHTSVKVSLSPGSPIPQIRIAENTVSSLVILDSTGKPWPIERFDPAKYSHYSMEQLSENVITISPLERYSTGNIVIKLKDLALPLIVTLSAGKHRVVDYTREVHVQRLGPNAAPPVIGKAVTGITDLPIHHFIDRVPPSGSKKVSLSGAPTWSEAWVFDNILYLRTQANLHSPAWIQSGSSADGTKVFALHPTPVLVVSNNGVIEKWRLKD